MLRKPWRGGAQEHFGKLAHMVDATVGVTVCKTQGVLRNNISFNLHTWLEYKTSETNPKKNGVKKAGTQQIDRI